MIYVTGDTHGDGRCFHGSVFRHMTKDDYVIVCGDFGYVFHAPKASWKEKRLLKWLDKKPWTTLFVDGNHENFDRLEELPVEEWHGGKTHLVYGRIRHLMRGQVFEIDGKKIFTFGGAQSIDREWRVPHESWWERELPNEEEYEEGLQNLEKNDWKVDYILTHDMPENLRRERKAQIPILELHTYLQQIYDKCTFDHWYCGHYHNNLDLDDKVTLLYGLCIPAGKKARG